MEAVSKQGESRTPQSHIYRLCGLYLEQAKQMLPPNIGVDYIGEAIDEHQSKLEYIALLSENEEEVLYVFRQKTESGVVPTYPYRLQRPVVGFQTGSNEPEQVNLIYHVDYLGNINQQLESNGAYYAVPVDEPVTRQLARLLQEGKLAHMSLSIPEQRKGE